jgi:hypothetical protein
MKKQPKGPRRAGDLLGRADALGGLAAAAREAAKLERALARALPADLRPHLRGAHLRDATLVILADGPAWATRLRFLEPELKAALDPRTRAQVRRVAVRVQLPDPAGRRPPEKARRTLSAPARAALEAGSARAKDPALAAAFARLARRRKPPTSS